MGDASRMNLSDRYLDEFATDIVEKCDLKVGQLLTVKSVYLQSDGNGFAPQLYASLEAADGSVFDLLIASNLFDCDYSSAADILDATTSLLRVGDQEDDQEQRRKLLKRINRVLNRPQSTEDE